jgi:glycerophosphoryl diester phosphodiesterase
MSPVLSPLERPAVLFASHGATAGRGLDPVEVVRNALDQGASGIFAVARTTADDVVVVSPNASIGTLRRVSVSRSHYERVASLVPRLDAVVDQLGANAELLVEVTDVRTMDAVLELAARTSIASRLWLANSDQALVASVRERAVGVRLLLSASLPRLEGGAERAGASMRHAGIDGVLLAQPEWTGGLTTLFHRFGRLAVSKTATHQRMITALLRMGIDGVVSDHPERLAAAAVEAEGLIG